MKKALKIFAVALDMAITWPFRVLWIIGYSIYIKIRYELTFKELAAFVFLGVQHGIKANNVFIEESLDEAVDYFSEGPELD